MCNVSSNCSLLRQDEVFIDVGCICLSLNISLSWKAPSGDFDVLHYMVNISSSSPKEPIIQNVTGTFFTIPVLPDVNYSVLVSTFSKCQQVSLPAGVDDEFVSVGK